MKPTRSRPTSSQSSADSSRPKNSKQHLSRDFSKSKYSSKLLIARKSLAMIVFSKRGGTKIKYADKLVKILEETHLKKRKKKKKVKLPPIISNVKWQRSYQLGRKPCLITCPNCCVSITTIIRKEKTSKRKRVMKTVATLGVNKLVKTFKSVEHRCPLCNIYLGFCPARKRKKDANLVIEHEAQQQFKKTRKEQRSGNTVNKKKSKDKKMKKDSKLIKRQSKIEGLKDGNAELKRKNKELRTITKIDEEEFCNHPHPSVGTMTPPFKISRGTSTPTKIIISDDSVRIPATKPHGPLNKKDNTHVGGRYIYTPTQIVDPKQIRHSKEAH